MKGIFAKKNRQFCTALKKGHCGFTLIEVLVASSILGIMMLLLFGSLRVCSRSWMAGEEHINSSSQMTVVQNFFRTYIEGALIVQDNSDIELFEAPDEFIGTQDEGDLDQKNLDEENEDDYFEFSNHDWVSFQGNEQELQFVSFMPASAGRGGLQVFNIQLIDGENQQLFVTITPFFPLLDDSQEVQEEISILDNVKNFAITYWGTKELSDEPEWNAEWNEPHLPRLVRIEIELENEPAWPVMIVSPRFAVHSEERG